MPLNVLLRRIYREEQIDSGCPEQFDITFDFVPRMCTQSNCSLCPYGKEIGLGQDLSKICIKDSSKYCPVVLVCCGYKKMCDPNNCTLIDAQYV